MTLRTRYWLFQVLGWGSYSILGVTIAAFNVGWSARIVTDFALYFIYSIGLTDALRQIIVRGQWLNPPVRLVWLRLAAAILMIAAIQVTLIVTIDGLLGGNHWARAAVPGVAWGTTAITASWTVLYVRLTERRRMQERELALELSLREAELRALQRQVNPHFLFNCLNSMRGLILEDPQRAQQMVTNLAEMLRYNLHREPRETVPLASELEIVRDYLELEAVRFEQRLQVHFDLDPDVGAIQVPVMLLPTLVENAVTHGIATRPEGGAIDISAGREGKALRLEIVNPGRLRDPRADGTGLANIRERLRLLYGDRARLSVDQRGSDRVRASVSIPIEA